MKKREKSFDSSIPSIRDLTYIQVERSDIHTFPPSQLSQTSDTFRFML